MSQGSLSKELFLASQKLIPGGVNSPVRSFKGVNGEPLFIEKGKGSKIYDADGIEYIDYVMSWGPLIFGHAPDDVLQKIKKVMERGLSFGAPTGFELELAKLVTDAFPSIEMVRFVNSGTEACMSAIRLARGYTNRKKILKFDGCYHGHVDSLLVKSGSGLATLHEASSAGIPSEMISLTTSVQFNDFEAVKMAVLKEPRAYAAIIVEPIAGNMGLVLPQKEFLQNLRQLCTEQGIVLIFDEVMTGFRVAMGGAQELYGVSPDLTCLGKIIGGGMPVGAYGGKKEIMEMISPLGKVYQAGTLSGNPVAMAAGIKTLKMLREPEVYHNLEYRTAYLCDEMSKRAEKIGIPMVIQRVGSMFSLYFSEKPIRNLDESMQADERKFNTYFHEMLEQGIYLPPSKYEAWFMSLAHTEDDFEKTLLAHEQALKTL